MAYAKKYLIEFTNQQKDIYHIYISEKDYEGNIFSLRGATDKPFVTSQQSGDDSIFNPIRAKECTLNFVAEQGISLKNFYSEDDEQFRIDAYCHVINGVVIDKLLSSFFIVQDSCEQEFAAEPFEVTLKGTDNIALLKNIPFTSAGMPYHPTDGSEFIGKISLFDLIKIAIQQTGLSDLPLRIYSNIFENTTADRSTDLTADVFEETYIFNAKYLNDDGTWQDLYTILNDILTTFNCTLCQENGAWNIIRYPEAYLFSNNAIPGVEHDLTTGTKTAITLNANIPIAVNTSNALDAADQISRIQRPFRYVKETFNYNQPKELIRNLNLQVLGNLITTYTDGDGNTVSEYEMPYWIPGPFYNIDSYFIRVITSPLQVELQRYAVLKGGVFGGPHVFSSSFYIDKNDRVSISFSIRTSDSQTGASNLAFAFQTDTGTSTYYINFNNGSHPINGSWSTTGGAIFSYSASQNLNEWTTFTVESLGCPVEGYFSIGLNQADFDSPINETHYKDFSLIYTPYINDSIKIIGQFHNNQTTSTIKNYYDEEIFLDDSPKHSISGALFTDALTGDDHNTLTALWHRSNIAEERRLGEIIVYERMHQAFKARTILEGTLYGLRNQLNTGEWNFVSPLCFLTVDSLPALNFIFGVLEVDFMNATYKAVLNELYQTDSNGEPFSFDYIFQYIYKTT